MFLDARLLTMGVSVILAGVGLRFYRTLLNPPTALCVPLAAALLIEAAFLPKTPFSIKSAAMLVGIELFFTVGAIAGRIGPLPTNIHIEIKGGRRIRRLLLFSAVVACATIAVGGRYIRHVYDAAGVGFTGRGVFDRGLVIASISGTKTDYIVRAITAFVFPTAAFVALYWLARGRFRMAIAVLYGLGVAILSLALRARLVAVLALVLIAIVLLLATGKRRIGRRVIPIVIVGPLLVLALFNQVAHERYGSAGSGRNHLDFLYATAGGPSALSVAMSGDQEVNLIADPQHHSRGQSVAGLLSAIGVRARGLGSFSSVYTGSDAASNINIYTGGWLLIWDLGTVLALMFMFLLGVVSRLLYGRLVRRATPGSVLTVANLLFLLACFPVTLISCYNLWWGIWLLAPIVNRVFQVRIEMARREPRQERIESLRAIYRGSPA